MFSNWQQEKAITARIDAARAMADRLDSAKPHIRDGHAAAAWFWAGHHLAKGQDLCTLAVWKPADAARFITTTETRIAALRRQRAYDSSDGLAVWLHTALAVAEPRMMPAVRDIWQVLAGAGPDADAMAADLLRDAGLPPEVSRRVPQGFAATE
ncbi:hypothetical protein GEU84_007540 [Fertoebacter nigrum]|uniref:Uncharacterized protein n=1 Tax=Fertoeibacter niger TaxID=2656921 RepID=A0A8X8GZE4_9RHOB|nr:hypothetical protein [Fertoeibacter niger]NUB44231.1 hypothetical protein [Fertoeibacter niger]